MIRMIATIVPIFSGFSPIPFLHVGFFGVSTAAELASTLVEMTISSANSTVFETDP